MIARTLLGLSVICFVTVAAVVSAQDEPKGRRLAVVVGNNEYRPNQGLDNLKQAVNDAAKLSEVLRSAGFKVAEMTHDVARQPGKAVFAPNADYIRDQIDIILQTPNLGRGDVVLISLHIHGVQYLFEEIVTENGRHELKKTPKFFFCPADATVLDVTRANDLTERNHLISLDELYQKLQGCKATTKLLIVDACRNDPSRIGNARNLESVTRPILPSPEGGIAAFFSCKANQYALEDPALQQGVFSHFLIQGLSGKADQPPEGKLADGVVTLSELTAYVSNNTFSYVRDKFQGRLQSPEMMGEFDTTLPLVHLPKDKKVPNPVPNRTRFGAYVDDSRGVVRVTGVVANSPATRCQNGDGRNWFLEDGDVITHVNAMPVRTAAEYGAAIQASPQAAKITVIGIRDKKTYEFSAQLNN